MLDTCTLVRGAPQDVADCISGRTLNYRLRGLNPSQRALVAARMVNTPVPIANLTTGQIAKLCRVSKPTLAAARLLPPDEAAEVRSGRRRISATSERLDRLVRRVGVEPLWRAICAQL